MTGLPFHDDYEPEPRRWAALRRWWWRGPRYWPCPHEAVFVDLLRQAVQQGVLTRSELRLQARAGQVRPDILGLLDLPAGALADKAALPAA